MAKENGESKRRSVASKTYIDAQGNESRHASPEAVTLRFTFEESGKVYDITLDEIGEKCRAAAMFHGLAQKLGDSYSGSKTGEEVIENFETVLERLRNDDWVRVGEGAGAGTRPSLVADAIKAALEEAGEVVDADRYASIREKVKTPESRKGALANPVINAHYERIKAERAAERAKEAKAAAKGQKVSLGDF